MAPALASDNPIRIDYEFELELEFLDVEGKGGFLTMDPNPLRVANKSARVKVDKAVLTPILRYRDIFTARFELRANDREAYVDRAFLRTAWGCIAPHLKIRAELGKNVPFIRPKRWTESYPLLGTAFWKSREYHAWVELEYEVDEFSVVIGPSIAQKRPLRTDDVAEDDSFKMLALDDTVNAAVGNNFTYGGKIALAAHGATLTGYGFRGKLTDNDDLKTLDQGLSEYDRLGDVRNQKHHWFGARAQYDNYGVHLMGEALRAQDGNLPRSAWYVQAFVDVAPHIKNKWLQMIGPIVQYGRLTVKGVAPDPDEPESWDRQMLVAGVLAGVTEVLKVKVEYYRLEEQTGSTAVADNQLLVQLRIQYGGSD